MCTFQFTLTVAIKVARLEPPRTDECHQASRHLPQVDFVTEPVPRNKVRSTLPLSLSPLRSPLQLGPGTRIRARVSQSCSACPQPVHSLWPLSFLDQRAMVLQIQKRVSRSERGVGELHILRAVCSLSYLRERTR